MHIYTYTCTTLTHTHMYVHIYTCAYGCIHIHSNLLADAICEPVSVEGPKIKMSVLLLITLAGAALVVQLVRFGPNHFLNF